MIAPYSLQRNDWALLLLIYSMSALEIRVSSHQISQMWSWAILNDQATCSNHLLMNWMISVSVALNHGILMPWTSNVTWEKRRFFWLMAWMMISTRCRWHHDLGNGAQAVPKHPFICMRNFYISAIKHISVKHDPCASSWLTPHLSNHSLLGYSVAQQGHQVH